eukprot:1006417-Karenia_brevis.AAC.1
MEESESECTAKKPASNAPAAGEQSETEETAKKPAAASPQAETEDVDEEHAPRARPGPHTRICHTLARGALGITRVRTAGYMRKPARES